MTDVRRIKLREQNRLRKRKQRENQKLPASCDSHTLSRDGHATDIEREKKIKIKIKKKKKEKSVKRKRLPEKQALKNRMK